MSDFATKLLPMVKKTLRQADDEFDDEIGSYIDTVATDLQNAGILSSFFQPVGIGWEPDSQILQACRWYSLSVFGLYNADMEKYAKAYSSLKATLATQREYTTQQIDEYTQGYEEGYAQGKAEGEVIGYQSGYEQGDADGKVKGQEIGYADALAKRTDLVVTANGEYTPSEDSTGFKSVSVNIRFENKLAQVADKTITEITAKDLRGATAIRDNMFQLCLNLKSVCISNTVKTIGRNSFAGDFSNRTVLETVEFEDNSQLTSIEYSAFSYSNKLKEIVIPASVTSIGGSVFSYDIMLISITMKSTTPPSIQSNSFSTYGSKPTIIVPIGSGDAYRQATNWSAYADQIVEGDV